MEVFFCKYQNTRTEQSYENLFTISIKTFLQNLIMEIVYSYCKILSLEWFLKEHSQLHLITLNSLTSLIEIARIKVKFYVVLFK